MDATITIELTLSTLGAEYQPFYPRFLVEVKRSDRGTAGEIDIRGTTEELLSMTIAQVYELALRKAKNGEWMNEPK